MAKRFSDTGKWNKPFMRTMPAPYKLLWLYILDECDYAGIWQVDIAVAELKIGEKLELSKAIKFFSNKIVEISSGEKWFIPDFIEFQYGTNHLNAPENPHSKIHENVLRLLRKHGLVDAQNKLCPTAYPHPVHRVKEKEKVKEKETEKGKEQEKEKDPDGEPVLKIKNPHTLSQEFYISHQKENKRECNWNGKYAGSLADVLKKLKKTYANSNGREPTDPELCSSFEFLIKKLPTFYEDKELSIINSNYDSIVNQIKNGAKQSSGGKSNRNNKDFHSQRNADQLRKLDGDPYGNTAAG